MTMDLKEIIKWFIPCFHILLLFIRKMNVRLTFVCLFLFFNNISVTGARVYSVEGLEISKNNVNTKKYMNYDEELNKFNQSEVMSKEMVDTEIADDTSVGRTFGRPFKKMMGALLPLIFQIGAASTWAVVAALVGVKTLLVTLIILKLLLVAGAAKFGALFASKGHQSHGWEQHPQKEIHLHIHNGQVSHDEHISPWSRDTSQLAATRNDYSLVMEPYSGPQTISTPYGNYVRVDKLNGFSRHLHKK